MYNYRPIDYSSDSEDDIFYGDENSPKTTRSRQSYSSFFVDVNDKVNKAVSNGDLEMLKQEMTAVNFQVNDLLNGTDTLLHIACNKGHLNIVEYLLLEKNANPNRQVDSTTPLMAACNCDINEDILLEIVKLLLSKGAVINVSNKFGMTPFMFACQKGYSTIVKLLIKDASLEAKDNEGNNALFHAVNNNHPEIVKLLIKANINLDTSNSSGYTARIMAEFNGFSEVLDAFPLKKNEYFTPSNYLSYSSIRDFIPRIYPKDDDNDMPEFFPEISDILIKTGLRNFRDKFALAKVNFEEFLTITDEKLKEIGFEFSFRRKEILEVLQNYHLDHWSVKDIAMVQGKEKETFYDVLLIIANHIKNAIILKSALIFVHQNLKNKHSGGLISKNDIQVLKDTVASYKMATLELQKTCKYLRSFSPEKPPLYINYDLFLKQKKKKKSLKKYLKYSILLGLSIVACLKVKKIIF